MKIKFPRADLCVCVFVFCMISSTKIFWKFYFFWIFNKFFERKRHFEKSIFGFKKPKIGPFFTNNAIIYIFNYFFKKAFPPPPRFLATTIFALLFSLSLLRLLLQTHTHGLECAFELTAQSAFFGMEMPEFFIYFSLNSYDLSMPFKNFFFFQRKNYFKKAST